MSSPEKTLFQRVHPLLSIGTPSDQYSRPLLQGVTVVELGHYVSAPLCGKLLADLGAEVIKIEDPAHGDVARRLPPFYHDAPSHDSSLLFQHLNANKKGVTLDINSPTGRRILSRLLCQAQVLIENLPPKQMPALGLGYGELSAANPGLIVTSITPFGHTGPYQDLHGADLVVFAMSGAAYSNPLVLDVPGRPPLQLPGSPTSILAGHFASAATLTALLRHQATGQGAYIDISELDVQVSILHGILNRYEANNSVQPRSVGLFESTSCPYDILPCKDGYVGVFCGREHQWRRLLQVMGDPEWGKVELFQESRSRRRHWPDLLELMRPWFMGHTKEEIYRVCQENDIPAAAVYTMGEVLQDRQFRSRDAFPEVHHPIFGAFPCLRPPYNLQGGVWELQRFAPGKGEHNREIFCHRLGYSRQELAQLTATGVT